MSAQRWDPVRYARHASFVAVNGESVLEWLALRPGERILDLGCGDGRLTLKLAEAACDVVGVDASPEQIEAARRLGLNAQFADARSLPFRDEFDVVFSNATLHWVKDARAAAASVFNSLRPGGRFVGEMGGAGNVAAIRNALHDELGHRGIDPVPLDPWYFPTPDEYRRVLEDAGFRVLRIAIIPRPTTLPTDLAGWLETFAGSFAAALPEADRTALFAAVQERVRPALQQADGSWCLADYTRVRFAALKPESTARK